MITLICWSCNKKFQRTDAVQRKSLKRGNRRFFCSRSCFLYAVTGPKSPSVECLCCGVKTGNPKFCSRSCSSSYNNTKKPKRKRTNQCTLCLSLIKSGHKYCKSCNRSRYPDPKVAVLADYLQSDSGRTYSTSIRKQAYDIAKTNELLDECTECGYSRHVQCCHIKPIASFPSDTPISVVNALSNLIGLCPTHHWELDNRYLSSLSNRDSP